MRCVHCNFEDRKSTITCRSCGAPLGVAEVSTAALPVGTKLQGAQYTVGKVLGQGGFGITYLGSDIELKRAVAIKEFFPQIQGCSRHGTTVRPGGITTEAAYLDEKHKFLAEGQRLAQFHHPHIVKVFSIFEANNTAYMVMELLRGKTLLKIIEERGPLDETEAVAYITQVAEALDVIHASKLLHRDVKPENIIITEERIAVLLDFGTAREFAAGTTRRMTTTLTQGYAPLEQYGQHAQFGVPIDVYALGATLYHLLTGEIPIQATDRAANVELPAPHRLNPKISSRVSSAILSAMEIRVDKRPQSIRDFLTVLRGFRAPQPFRLDGDPAEPTRGKAEPRTAKKAGFAIIHVHQIGSLSTDCEVTIYAAKAISGSSDRLQPYKSVTLSRKEISWGLELAHGEYRIWATCTSKVRETLVFATRLLKSNECDLIVPPGWPHLTLTLERFFDGLHLRENLPTAPFPQQPRTLSERDTGRLEIRRSKNMTIGVRIMIEFECQASLVMNQVIMSEGEREARIDLVAGSYMLWATINGELTNCINLIVLTNLRVCVRVDVDRISGDGYMIEIV